MTHLQGTSPVAEIKVGNLMAPVANFFEQVGFFTRRGVFDEEMAPKAISSPRRTTSPE